MASGAKKPWGHAGGPVMIHCCLVLEESTGAHQGSLTSLCTWQAAGFGAHWGQWHQEHHWPSLEVGRRVKCRGEGGVVSSNNDVGASGCPMDAHTAKSKKDAGKVADSVATQLADLRRVVHGLTLGSKILPICAFSPLVHPAPHCSWTHCVERLSAFCGKLRMKGHPARQHKEGFAPALCQKKGELE